MMINKKTTRKNSSNKRGVIIPKTFLGQLQDHFFSVSIRPTWTAIILLLLYSIIKPWTDSKLDYGILFIILGLAIIFTGFIAIRRKEYPGLFGMYTGAAATNLGWLTIIPGVVAVAKGILQIIQNLQ
jgi:hypothetical protein